MAVHKFSIRQTFEVTQYITDQFDTDDQEKWDAIKAMAQGAMRAKDFDDLPESAPDDIEIWFNVYRYIDTSRFSDVNQEQGECTSEYIICDEDGVILIEE
jgi:hypothetical protein